ncbi:unnamed protein product [Peniophora sp. CBMAI 1063]|nr:unnamed protein product [Peniophora sp. CBMAI 1063]
MSTPQQPPTDYAAFVLSVISDASRRTAAQRERSPPASPFPEPDPEKPSAPVPLDQAALRYCLHLSSTYLVSDATTNPAGGLTSWNSGFNRIIDVLDALHARGELELETVNAASRACSECWTAAGNWRTLEGSRGAIRAVAGRLRRLLDENGKTFKGSRVYVP